MQENEKYPSDEYISFYQDKGYKFLGKQTAAYKPCHYWKSALTDRIFCYKYHFYGIPTHRCVQWSPTLECNESCQFCWRYHRKDLEMAPYRKEDLKRIDWPAPEHLFDDLLQSYKGTLKGFKPKYRDQTEKDLWMDAWTKPPHLATSLTGEPLIYPYIGEVMEIAEKKGMSTFIVSNGTFPEKLEQMDTLPTQLYLTLAGSNYKMWAQLTQPLWDAKKQWKNINKSLELLPTLNTRTVIRITAVKKFNMQSPKEYSKLIEKAEPNFISVKGFSHIGGARKRLKKENQPEMEEMESFAEEISKKTGYKIEEKVERGRAILLWDETEKRMISKRDFAEARR